MVFCSPRGKHKQSKPTLVDRFQGRITVNDESTVGFTNGGRLNRRVEMSQKVKVVVAVDVVKVDT
jgi:hypothetical protein